MLRSLSPVLAGATALLLATLSANAATVAPAPAAAAPPRLVIHASLDDVTVDPTAAAIKAAVNDAVKRGFIDKRDRPGLLAYYAATGYTPLWTVDEKLSDRALALIARLKQADTDGLYAANFPTPDVAIGTTAPASVQQLAAADVLLSQAIIAYAHEAHAGVLDPATVSPNISYQPHLPDSSQVLANVTTAADPAVALASYNPQNPEFLALRDALAAARAPDAPKLPTIAAGNVMKIGLSDARVPALRDRLGVKVDPAATDPKKFDQPLVDAVKAFQQNSGLNADGAAGPATIAALNSEAGDHVALLLANMERWRWMPEDLGEFYVRVNLPNYNLDVYQDGKVIWTTRIVIGKVVPINQTPIFSDEIETVAVNPVWNVPSSIVMKEMLPDILANPGAALAGYDVYYNANGRYQQVDPRSIDWTRVDMNRIQVKQPPGPANALGTVKFLFPNPFDVYLHDTPAKSLFGDDQRADSHGCMRVQDPWGFADVLMTQEKGITTAGLKKLIGGTEQQVNLPTQIPVHITYFTAWVDASGKLQIRNDVYGLDQVIEKSLGLQAA